MTYFWCEKFLSQLLRQLRVEVAAREDVDVNLAQILSKVRADVRGFDQLYVRIAGGFLLVRREVFQHGFAVGDHVNRLDQGLAPGEDVIAVGDLFFRASGQVQNNVLAPNPVFVHYRPPPSPNSEDFAVGGEVNP